MSGDIFPFVHVTCIRGLIALACPSVGNVNLFTMHAGDHIINILDIEGTVGTVHELTTVIHRALIKHSVLLLLMSHVRLPNTIINVRLSLILFDSSDPIALSIVLHFNIRELLTPLKEKLNVLISARPPAEGNNSIGVDVQFSLQLFTL